MAFLSCRGVAMCEDALRPCDRVTNERGFRQAFTVSVVEPIYPEESIRAQHSGIAIARICVAAGSTSVTSIEVVAAPDEAIARSMKTALQQWRFALVDRRDGRQTPFSAGTKVTYYFTEQAGRWVVLNPMNSFYLGPRFALAQ
jgi:hypothetical protein